MAKATKDQHKPTGFGGAELVLVGPAVALAKHVYDAVKEGRPALSPDAPLTFGVADSVTSPSGHCLVLMVSNLGAHGVYVEDVIVSDPADVEVTGRVRKKEHSSMSLDHSHGSDGPPVLLPILVPSGGSVILVVTISPLSTVRMKKKPFGKLSVSYTVLGLASTGLKHEVEFSVRSPVA